MNQLNVVFFLDKNNKSPVEEFLNRLSDVQFAKIIRQLQYLKEFGFTIAIPNSKKITGTPLWELRILGKDNLRIFYAQTAKGIITILHIFYKKKQKTPQKDLSLALSRYHWLVDK